MTLTCVSGYWRIKNKHDNKFENWFNNTLKINCPYVFFSDKETIEIIKKYRGDLPTHYIECSIKDFYTYNFKDKMITHPVHCPSVELNLVWNEKIFLIEKAIELNPFKSEYFMWIDAGMSSFRNRRPPQIPFPNINKINKLPKDKFIYSSTHNFTYNEKFVKGQYHLHHHVSGTYLFHKNIINKLVDIYKKYLSLIDKNDIWTDQVIWTLIYNDNKELFYKLCDNYATIPFYLY
tara:strand:+ start:18622 stop:19323 length:702 start_codon:yes stop_codon:yes gene_type:complete